VDLVQLGGGVALKAIKLDFAALVDDGFLNIKLNNAVANQPSTYIFGL